MLQFGSLAGVGHFQCAVPDDVGIVIGFGIERERKTTIWARIPKTPVWQIKSYILSVSDNDVCLLLYSRRILDRREGCCDAFA